MFAELASGALSGAATGATIGGPIGAGVGALAGGALGYMSANSTADAQAAARQAAAIQARGLRKDRRREEGHQEGCRLSETLCGVRPRGQYASLRRARYQRTGSASPLLCQFPERSRLYRRSRCRHRWYRAKPSWTRHAAFRRHTEGPTGLRPAPYVEPVPYPR